MSLTTRQREWITQDAQVLQPFLARGQTLTEGELLRIALDDYLAALEGLLREIEAYCAPIAPSLDPVGKALYERIGPLLAVGE